MQRSDFELTANSAITLDSSGPKTRTSILSGIERLRHLGENDPDTTPVPASGHYVTRIGDTRIVWTRKNDDGILVLTIFAPNQ